jgi:hypothetical protein
MRNIKNYFENKNKKTFNPLLYFKYAEGVGDIVTAILHSKFIGPLTYMITGKFEPCVKCNNRRVALNMLFPIPFWKLFFKNETSLVESLKKEYEKIGIDVEYQDHHSNEINPENNEYVSNDLNNSNFYVEEKKLDRHLLNETTTKHDDLIIVISIYKEIKNI